MTFELILDERHKKWQGRQDLNPQHLVLETSALPLELLPCTSFTNLL
jgi:hypothetical protein